MREQTACTIELIKALLEGKTLVRYGELSEKETFNCEWGSDGKPFFWMNGWGSALGTSRDRIMSLLENPEQWEVELPNLEVCDARDAQ